MSMEKELRGENGAFDTETAGFGGGVRFRSARKRPKSGKCYKQLAVVGVGGAETFFRSLPFPPFLLIFCPPSLPLKPPEVEAM